jgi:hypothetical protein
LHSLAALSLPHGWALWLMVPGEEKAGTACSKGVVHQFWEWRLGSWTSLAGQLSWKLGFVKGEKDCKLYSFAFNVSWAQPGELDQPVPDKAIAKGFEISSQKPLMGFKE